MTNDEQRRHDGTDRPRSVAPRTRRAREESMDIALLRTGVYVVHSGSGGRYEVDVIEKACTCPDWQESRPPGGCKHMRRVNLEIRAGTVPRPDGRLPSSALADGGQSVAAQRTNGNEGADRINGPHWEYDCDGACTGVLFYRCTRCGAEAIRRTDLLREPCCRS